MYVLRIMIVAILANVVTGCMEWDYGPVEDISATGRGLFIVCEGNFQYGNSSLSYYSPELDSVQNEVFFRANGMKLGDVGQSMTIRGEIGWIVSNHSHVIFAISTSTFKEQGRITGFTSPRYIHFISDTKAYVSQLWDNRIFIIDPSTYTITGHIEVPDMEFSSGSTEQMVQIGPYVYVNCWSYQNRIIKVDTRTDRVVEQMEVGIQPNSLVADAYGRLWTLTDGGYEGSPQGIEEPALHRINPQTMSVEASFPFYKGDTPSELCTNEAADTIYWLNDDVWAMDVGANRLPLRPVVRSRGTKYYGLTVSPFDSDIYVADAVDYQQCGTVYRYSPSGKLKSEFMVGVTPGAFAWKKD